MSTVAEGVEDEKQLARLSEIGIDFVQGYLNRQACTSDGGIAGYFHFIYCCILLHSFRM